MASQTYPLWQSIKNLWTRWITPPAHILDKAARRRSRFLAATSLILIGVALILTVMAILLSHGKDADIFTDTYSLFVGIAVLVAVYWLNFRGRYRLASWLLIGISIVIVFWGGVPFDDATDADFLVYLVIPVLLTFVLLNSRSALIVAAGNLLGIMLLPLFFNTLQLLPLMYFQGSFMIIVLMLSWMVDSQRKQLEREQRDELREREQQLRLITDNIQEIIFFCNADGEIRYVSPSLNKTLGISPEANKIVTMQFWSEMIHPDDRKAAAAAGFTLMRERIAGLLEYRIRHADGHYIWFETLCAPLSKEGGLETVFTCRDITQRKEALQRAATAERARQEAVAKYASHLESEVAARTAEAERAQQRAETILMHSGDAIVLLRKDHSISQSNPAFSKLMGYRSEEMINQPLENLVRTDDQLLLTYALEKLPKTITERLELVITRKDGSEFYADVILAAIPNSDDPMVVCTLHDISSLKMIEDGLRKALEKERELSELKSAFVTTVSHEFRTPLAIIQSSSDLLKNYGERLTDDRKAQHLNTIQTQVQHMTQLLPQMIAYIKDEGDLR